MIFTKCPPVRRREVGGRALLGINCGRLGHNISAARWRSDVMGSSVRKRRTAAVLIAGAVVIGTFGCAKPTSSINDLKKPLSPDVQKYSEKIVSVLDQYLDLELTIPETAYQLAELNTRFEDIGVPSLHDRNVAMMNDEPIPGNGKFSESDFVVSDELSSTISDFSDMAEIERSMLRDTIASAAGLPVARSDYPARQYEFHDTPDGAIEILGLQEISFDSISIYESEDLPGHWRITLHFDTMNGVDYQDIKSCVTELADQNASRIVTVSDITVFIQSYNYALLYLLIAPGDASSVTVCKAIRGDEALKTFAGSTTIELLDDAFEYLERHYAI